MKTLCYRGVPVLGFAAFSGVGKTTTLKHLIPHLISEQIRVAIVKHTHHGLEIDHKGKDSYQLREAGASQIVVGSNERRAVILETPELETASLSAFLSHLDPQRCDIILVEGFRHHAFPKVEIYRDADNTLLAEKRRKRDCCVHRPGIPFRKVRHEIGLERLAGTSKLYPALH